MQMMFHLNSLKIKVSTNQKSQSLNSKSQLPNHKRWLYSVWYLELGISMFFPSERIFCSDVLFFFFDIFGVKFFACLPARQ
jgi:hypothetical protein